MATATAPTCFRHLCRATKRFSREARSKRPAERTLRRGMCAASTLQQGTLRLWRSPGRPGLALGIVYNPCRYSRRAVRALDLCRCGNSLAAVLRRCIASSGKPVARVTLEHALVPHPIHGPLLNQSWPQARSPPPVRKLPYPMQGGD